MPQLNGLRELAEARALSPKQQWGSADGHSHELSDGSPNQDEPVSLQSKYPSIKGQSADAVRNDVEVKPTSSDVRGFDASTSKELPGQRGERERTYRNADGSLTTEFSQSAVNYRKPDGTWAPIDTTFVSTGDGWRNAADRVDLRLAGRASEDSLVRMRFDDQHEVAFGLRGTAASAGVADGSTVTYPQVMPGVDLKFEAQSGGVKEIMVLASADAPHSWTFPLRLKGLTAKVVDDQVVLHDRDGNERGRFPRGFMTDSSIDPNTGDPALSYGVKYQIADGVLKVEVDSAWLRDPARKFPVLVDPTIETREPTRARFYQGTWNTESTELKVGNSGGLNSAAYLDFGGVENTLANHKIHGAALALTNYWSWSCSPRPVTVHAVTAPWGGGGFPGPAYGEELSSASFAHGYIAPMQTRSNCPTAVEQINLGVKGRDLIQRWVTGAQANHGLTVRGSESDVYGWKKFTSKGTANPPRLYITHSPYDAEYRIDRGVPEPAVLANRGGKVKLTVTNRGAQTWTPSTFAFGYRVFTDAGSPVRTVETALPHDVPRGGSATIEVQIDALDHGTYLLDFSMLRKGGPWFTDEHVPPARLSFRVPNIPPLVKAQYPPNGYSAATLTPQLWVDAVDVDSPPNRALKYRFQVCEDSGGATPSGCFDSGNIDDRMWTVPKDKMFWGRVYMWRATAIDDKGQESEALPWSTLLTSVPQPSITTHLANAPYNGANKAFDPNNGNYFSSAIDASITGSGPELSVARTYNSLDPRRDLLFGAGWSTRWDMKVVPDDDGSGNVLVTLPDGQQVRFGRNPGGGFAPAPGRQGDLHPEPAEFGGGWTMVDTSSTSYRFGADGKLTKITDQTGQQLDVRYEAGKLSQVVNPRSGRKLTFAWSGAHVQSVTTDVVNGKALVWTYKYTGDKLTEVCDPANGCTKYDYAQGSHYRSAVIDSIPGSYWRLGDPDGTRIESQVRTNLGKDDGTAKDTSWTAGAIAGSPDGARTFNGSSSFVKLPPGLIKKNRDLAVEMWFKTTAGGPLLGMQHFELGSATPPSSPQLPVLWVGTDGKLRGNFWNGKTEPITTTGAVNDNNWHHVVLSGSLGTQSLFVDGKFVASALGEINHLTMTQNQIGAASSDGWPGLPAGVRYFSGVIDEVAFYEHPIGTTAAKQHFESAAPSDQLTKITLPSGRVAATMSYDVVNDRLREYVDRNGGQWQLAAPAVTGTEQNLVRTTMVRDPGNRFHYADYDPARGRVLRSLTPLGQGVRPEDLPPGTSLPPGGDQGGPNQGQGVRTFDYDARGFLSKIVDENGNKVELTNDSRGNPISRKTCRTSDTDCHTSYSSYYNNPSDLTDPRNGKLLTASDGRSSGPDDTRYRTTNTYTGVGVRGLIESQVAPDGSTARHTYTTSSSVGPAGLVETTIDGRGAKTSYSYYASGDLEKVTNAAGLVTKFTYDALGRKITQTEISQAYPQGLTSTYTYDELSRLKTVTRPATTNKITGVKHTLQTTYEYDADGNTTATQSADLTGGDQTRRVVTEYDGHGRAARVTDSEGNVTTSGYDTFGNLAWTVDAVGTKQEFAYTARQKIAEVRLRAWHGDPVGPGGPGGDGEGQGDTTVRETLVVQAFAYDLAGRLTRETDAMGRAKRYEYYRDDSVRRVVASKIRDPFDPVVAPRDLVLKEYTYDGAGNVVREASAGGLAVENTYDALNRVRTSKADPAGIGRLTTYDYDAGGNVTKVAVTGKPSNSVHQDVQRTTAAEFGYDAAGRRTSETAFNGTERLTTSSVLDDRGLLRSVTDPRGTSDGADRAAFTTDYGYDEGGNAVSVTAPPAQVEDNGTVITSRPSVHTGLDAFGGAVELKDAKGNISKQAFDKLGRVVRTESAEYTKPGASNGARSVTLTEYTPLGDVRKVTDPRGAVTEYSYDQLRRVVAAYQADATVAGRTNGSWLYSYTRAGERLSITDPTGARAEATYDDLGRQVTATRLERRPAVAALVTKSVYDDASNLKAVTSPSNEVTTFTYDALGQRISAKDAAGVVTKFGYDSAGRQSRVSDGLNRTSFQSYDTAGRPSTRYDLDANESLLRMSRNFYDRASNVVKTTDPLNRSTNFTFDALGRMVNQVEPVADGKSITTSFGYDAAGNRSRFTDGRGNATTYRTNSLGLPESVIEPATEAHPNAVDRTWTRSYDLAGNVERVVAPGGVTRTLTYDYLNRLTGETGEGAEASTASRSLGYDAAGRLTSFNAPGGTNTLEYNDRGALLSATGPSGDSQFTYDDSGRLTQQVDASGTARYTYHQGRLSTVQDGLTGAAQAFGYNEAGQVKSVTFAGKVRSYDYDVYGRQISDVLRDGTTTLSSIEYGYELNDLVKSKKTSGLAGSGEHTYAYDYAGRMTAWSYGGKTTSYEWDDAGNRVKADGKTSTYDARNRLMSDGDKSYTWAARGTLRSSGSDAYEFDAFGRSVKRGATTFGYDALDRMVTRGAQKFSYVGASLGLASDGSQKFSRGPGGELLATQRGLAMTDMRGDVLAEFSTSGQNAGDTTTYDPFGKVVSGARTGLGYQGDWTDPDSGEVDMGARWYSPSTGGFTARDSISLPTSPSGLTNRYAYGRGAPATYVDPDGHQTDTIIAPGYDDYVRGKEAQRDRQNVRSWGFTAIRFGKFVPGVGGAISAAEGIFSLFEKPEVQYVQSPVLKNLRFPKNTTAGSTWFSDMLRGLYGQLVNLGRYLKDLLGGIRWPGGYGSVNAPQPVWDPSVAARAEAEKSAKEVALAPPAAATQPIVEAGVVSSNPQAPASRVAVEMGDVQDANEVVRQVREAVLGTDNPVIQNAAEQNPSELSGSGSGTNIYTEDGIFKVVKGEDGSASHRQVAWNGGGEAEAVEEDDDPKIFTNLKPEDEPNFARSFSADVLRKRKGKYQYVVFPNGAIKVGQGDGHVSLARGRDVIAAGEVKIAHGEVVWMDNDSGHYKPRGRHAKAAAEAAFDRIGLNGTGKYIDRFPTG
ncbi:RHS repeat-associated core domain-containing protein [Lentzea albidocapillata]|uniref:RHS repeat-associated core domain-containing protein n=1 Tax=Lentzea albidocapillata TaxID=40571 RepID=A0A1W2E1D9_9PSEU|nr:RHS repeat-associated core domain-containing protein [Lentzea albidocapillata]SMD03222.1 RHS repeat-associated core domain-containing protein [Lentzea albidocapillata]